MRGVGGWVERVFLDHPRGVGESYLQHMRQAARFGGLMMLGAAACFVHALVPALCTRTGSGVARRLHEQLAARARMAAE